MRRPSVFSREGDFDATMTPMIDVVFLLLVFFVWTASFQVVERMMPSRVSLDQGGGESDDAAPPPAEADFDYVVVRVLWRNSQPAWEMNGRPVGGLTELKGRLEAIARIKPDAPVILHPDPGVPLGHVIDAFDMSRLAGFQTVQFAAAETDTRRIGIDAPGA